MQVLVSSHQADSGIIHPGKWADDTAGLGKLWQYTGQPQLWLWRYIKNINAGTFTVHIFSRVLSTYRRKGRKPSEKTKGRASIYRRLWGARAT